MIGETTLVFSLNEIRGIWVYEYVQVNKLEMKGFTRNFSKQRILLMITTS